jgi:hypothetical protein
MNAKPLVDEPGANTHSTQFRSEPLCSNGQYQDQGRFLR